MSNTRDDVTKITLDDLIKQRDNAETRLRKIKIDLATAKPADQQGQDMIALGRVSTTSVGSVAPTFGSDKTIWDVLYTVDPKEDFCPSTDQIKVVSAMRDAFCLFYELKFQLKRKDELNFPETGVLNDADKKKLEFTNAYALFAASSFVLNRLKADFAESEKNGSVNLDRTQGFFNFAQGKENSLMDIVQKYSAGVKTFTDKKIMTNGSTLVNFTYKFFKWVADEAQKKREVYEGLAKYVESDAINVADEVTIEGFELPDLSAGASRVEFVPVHPDEVIANRQAKRKVIRYMDRLCLYDAKARMNPCLQVGGLSWTNLWDGIPGTGKTTMERMAMTRLREVAEAIGIPYFIHEVDQKIKNEFYGKTGQNLLQIFKATRNPDALHFILMDDIDMLTSGGRNDSAGGADKDIMAIIMQFLDGAFTERLGNAQVYAASNDPKGLEGAIRNRFNDRLVINGPETVADMADLFKIKLAKLDKAGKLKIVDGYDPFATQDNYVNGKWTCPADVVHDFDPELRKRFKKATLFELAAYAIELKKQFPSISGRSINAVSDTVKERSADFDIAPEIWTDRTIYLDQTPERKIEIVRDLCTDVEPWMIAEELKRYAESEARYAANEKERAVEKGYNSLVWGLEARRQYLAQHGGDELEARAIDHTLSLMAAQANGIQERILAGLKQGGKQ